VQNPFAITCRECEHCKSQFIPIKVTQRFCSKSCRLAKLHEHREGGWFRKEHPNSLRPWLVLCFRLQGLLDKDIASHFSADEEKLYAPSTITTILAKLGLRGTKGGPYLYDCGEIVTVVHAAALLKASGVDLTDFKCLIGMTSGTRDFSRPRSQAEGKALRFDNARRLIAWRDSIIRTLAGNAGTQRRRRKSPPLRYGHRGYRVSGILKTLLPRIRPQYELLLEVLQCSTEFLKSDPQAGIEQWQDWICEQACHEDSGRRSGELFSRFLPWAPEASPFIAMNLDSLRNRTGLHRLTKNIFAARFGVTPSAVEESWQTRTRAVRPEDMARLILSMSRKVTPEVTRPPAAVSEVANTGSRKGGKKAGYLDDRTKNLILLAAALERTEVKTTYAMAPTLYPLGPRRDHNGAESATRLFRKRHAEAIQKQVVAMTSDEAAKIIDAIRLK
jgi:hypothetical protein